ncbi:hypothetical protein LTR62_001076 [Meristemomyces frigidus]|uniref:Cutinase n=1 Tax=Meristemomyces frigidus TaxID=1508187 RepID=A0AAN7T9K7_9PEZI|nr:hypothetical protein LTR62_001076 [Meristemomyces frigidus]
MSNPGRQGNLTTRVCNDLPGMSCDYEDIAYDAISTDYCPSVAAGEALALSQINAYYAKCPDTAIVLSGYSEGATVMGNVLAGDGGDVFCPSTGHPGITDVSSGVACNIAAVTLFGNPRHTANQPYNVLAGVAGEANSHRDAQGLARMAYYTPRLHDYCNYDDLICAAGLGANTVEAHTNYFELYSAEAAQYIADLVKVYTKGSYCAVPTTSSSSSAAVTTSFSSSGSITVPVTITASASAVTYPNGSFPCNPAHDYGNGASCISTAGSLTLVTPTASVPFITVTELTSVYTTVCPLSSVITSGNMTSTSTWTGPSAVTTTYSSTYTTTVAATYVPPPTTPTMSALTTLGGTPAVVSYATSVSTTTYANFPTLSYTKSTPTATYWLNGQGMSNGTEVTGFMASGSGAMPKPTGSSPAPIMPYTGAASNVVAASWFGAAAGVIGLMMI